ncbi:MAG: HNH endonuclease signature motif containing protein [Dermatophilaceae bacterium]
MTPRPATLAEFRGVLQSVRGVAARVPDVLHKGSRVELAGLMTLLDEVAAATRAAQVQVAVEVVRSGEVTGREVDSWVKCNAPSLRQGGWYPLAKIAAEVAATSRGSGLTAAGGLFTLDQESPLGVVWAAMTDAGDGARDHDAAGSHVDHDDADGCAGVAFRGVGGGGGSGGVLLAPRSAMAVLAEVAKLTERLVPEAVPTVTSALVDLSLSQGTGTMRRLRPALLAKHGLPGEFDTIQERLASAAYLSTARVRSAELTEYALAMTPAQAAVLEAAIGPRSAPAPNDQTGEPDLRPAGQRRVEALTEVISRGAALDVDEHAGADGAAGSAVALHVTVPLADLYDTVAGRTTEVGAGEVHGSVATGMLIGPGQLRRIACDAVLIPYVLGSAGEVVDQGLAVRLFTRAQRRRLTMRDRGCTYPGCSAPASWCITHHVRWWEHEGRSDIDNGALLCRRHHTVVHQRRLWAAVRERPDDHGRSVTWDLRPGSYDHALDQLRGREAGVEKRRSHANALLGEAFPGSSAAISATGRHFERWHEHHSAVGDDLTGHNPVGHDPVGDHTVAHDPVAHHAVAHDPVAHHAVAHDPVGHDPVGDHPVAHDPVAHDPVGQNLDDDAWAEHYLSDEWLERAVAADPETTEAAA